ncbi:hypothetical protein TSOC_012121 [Tetrabaena socialis]|uniref:SGNH hydrolase-type esterase domain-containing protein n=1 Tax=Tetrabaena socialis TaxID=47790 RepID=A0A2J7ZNU1_9CHLO|nr:hypothetical protein TSOC_012121 [Tetrabaena socialis]|eukprot:PNH01936.1 hypothetical protein TSOC_012121 [Tetrabaena socialis]
MAYRKSKTENFLGLRISWGQFVTTRGETDWFSIFTGLLPSTSMLKPRWLLLVALVSLSALDRGESILETFMGLNPYERTRNRPELEWDWKHTWSTIHVNQQPVSQVLASALGSYRFTLPRAQLHRGTAYTGASSRLKRLVKELMVPHERKEFKIAVVGGSVSWGQFTSRRGETDWFSVFTKWMNNAFPRANITARNGCTPGVPTPYMIMCLELSVDPDVDLVFMEYTLNDATDPQLIGNKVVMDTERLVRRILALPNRPAVVFLHVPTFGMPSYPAGHPKNPNGNDSYVWVLARGRRLVLGPFYHTSEDAQISLAQYYDVQYLSLRTAVYRLAAKETPGFMWEELFVVPSAFGARARKRWPPRPPAPPRHHNPLSSPLPPRPVSSLVALAEGFEWVNEGTAVKPKPGYVATRPGARLQLRLDTDRSAVGSAANENVHVYLHHLRSYQHMGSAKLSCVSGCSCPEVVVDAHITEQVSQVYLALVVVTQAKECVVEVQVLDQSKSGEHKFKVSGVVVAERAGAGTAIDRIGGDNQPFGLRQHNGDDLQVPCCCAGLPCCTAVLSY